MSSGKIQGLEKDLGALGVNYGDWGDKNGTRAVGQLSGEHHSVCLTCISFRNVSAKACFVLEAWWKIVLLEQRQIICHWASNSLAITHQIATISDIHKSFPWSFEFLSAVCWKHIHDRICANAKYVMHVNSSFRCCWGLRGVSGHDQLALQHRHTQDVEALVWCSSV